MADALDLAQQHDEAFNSQDADARKRIEADNIEVTMPGGMTMQGPDQVIEVVRVFWEALPDGKINAEKSISAGDTVVNEGSLTGTHTGPFRSPAGEVPPSGNNVNLRYAAVKRFEGDKLVSEHLYFDQLEFMQQIGAMPS
jgi:steroid delta-isomerase-like uncharacterized protein